MAIIIIKIRTPNKYLVISLEVGDFFLLPAPHEITKLNVSKRAIITIRISTFPNINIIPYTC